MVTDDVLARWLAIHQDELRSGEKVIVRKAERADIPLIYEYLAGLSDEDRRNRYFTSLPLELLQAQQRLERIYDRTLDHIHHEAYVVVGADGKILGGHILGANAGELIAPIVYAMRFGLTAKMMAEAMLPYPTMAEAVRWAAAQL